MSSGVATDLRAIFDGGTVAGLDDAPLLERFASGRAEEAEPAFAALVRRHGPMVLGVCRGVLKDPDDAEDAFQATFLTLARKAGSLREPELLGPWLHGVAGHTARRLKDKIARRRRHEAEASISRATHSDRAARHDPGRSSRDEIEALHEEIERLPERYRTAIVLCDLQGLTHQEAGRRLGRPAGTISARLSRARERLRGRLIRRGVALPAGALVATGTAARASGLPAPLLDSTVHVAMAVSSGPMAASLPTAIATLSREVSRSMLLAKWMMISATALALGAAATGAGVLVPRDGQGPAAPSPPPLTAGPAAAVAPDDPLPPGARLRLGTSRFRPPSGAVEIALSPDETTLVTVGGELVAWDAATGTVRWRAPGKDYGYEPPAAAYGLRALAFAPDGSRFYTPGKPGAVVAWETASGRRQVLQVGTPGPRDGGPAHGPRSIDVSPDGRMLASGSATGIVVCDRHGKAIYKVANNPARPLAPDDGGNDVDRLKFAGDYSLARFSPDGRGLAIVTSDRPEEIRILEAETGRELRKIALAARLVRMAYSTDGKQFVTTERDNAVRLYDVETGGRIWSRVVPLKNPYENYTSAVAFRPDGRTIAAGATDNRIHLFDAANGEERTPLTGHQWYPWTLAFTADGRRLYSSGWDRAIRRWDVAERKELTPPAGVRATPVVAASPDGQTLAYADDSGTIRLVDARSGAERGTIALEGTAYSRLTFSPDGRRLAGGGTVGDQVHVAVWDLPDGRLLRRWDWPKGRDPHSEVESLAFAPDGTRLAAAVFRQSSAYIWDLTTGRELARLSHDQIHGISFSPDGRTLATAGWDSIIRIWEADTGRVRREDKVGDRRLTRDIIYAVCHASGGGIIATAQQHGTVRIWQADDMRPREPSIRMEGGFVYGAMSFSPDGLWLATGSADGRVELWDPATGQRVWDRGRHQSFVYTVGFGRDDRTLVSGGDDGACYLWDLRPPGDLPARDPARLWDDLAGDDGPAAYLAIWALSDIPDRAVPLIAERLRPVKTVIDPDRVEEGISQEEIRRRRRLRKLLIDKDPKVESAIAARRALLLLARIGTPGAIALLDELAKRDPQGDLGRLAAAAMARAGRPARP